ncbi:MAG TPA: hypothetical protein VHR72_11575 [Gemmataceae bacterium]|jgi:hypothetical protein|nr:hypothetical protein [Gemmataceae bacterium]
MTISPMILVIAILPLGAFVDGPMDFKITPKDGDSVDVKVDKDRTLFDVKSPFGIGRASIERRKSEWPGVVTVRLRLKGLEHLKIVAGAKKLEAAVGVRNGRPEIRAWKDGDENHPLGDKSPYWPMIAVIDRGQPAQTSPLTDGWFDIELPRALLEGNPASIVVNWIDFYRN